jgi:hypothetical protein
VSVARAHTLQFAFNINLLINIEVTTFYSVLCLQKERNSKIMTKRIRLSDVSAIRELINKAEGRASVRCITPDKIITRVEDWERKVYFPAKNILRGVKLEVHTSATKIPNCYNGIPMETVVYLEHDTVGWYVVKASRECVHNSTWSVKATPTESLCVHIIKNALIY